MSTDIPHINPTPHSPMDSEADPLQIVSTLRHKCAGCFKQYKKKEHLIEHMRTSFHSVHQPKCGVCQKQCKSFESLREHIAGPLAKALCTTIFAERGCSLCMKVLDCPNSLHEHKEFCCFPAPAPLGPVKVVPGIEHQIDIPISDDGNYSGSAPKAVAMDCEMVGGGSDGTLDLCARVCLIDEDEKVIFHTYVLPQIFVTNYRSEVTGITEDHLKDAMPLKKVQEKIMQILYNGESMWSVRSDGGKARILVGHQLDHDMECLRVNYPDHLLRDTAKYQPLTKTNLASHSLKYLTRTYLGYDIQVGIHDPYEDCVSVLRLYKRMRAQDHQVDPNADGGPSQAFSSAFDPWKCTDLENMTPEDLLASSRSNFRCWCFDSLLKIKT